MEKKTSFAEFMLLLVVLLRCWIFELNVPFHQISQDRKKHVYGHPQNDTYIC